MSTHEDQWEVWDESVFEAAAAARANSNGRYPPEKPNAASFPEEPSAATTLPPYEASSSKASGTAKDRTIGYGFSEYSLVSTGKQPMKEHKKPSHAFRAPSTSMLVVHNELVEEELPPFSPQDPSIDEPDHQRPPVSTSAEENAAPSTQQIQQPSVAAHPPTPTFISEEPDEIDEELPPFTPHGPSLDGPAYQEREEPQPTSSYPRPPQAASSLPTNAMPSLDFLTLHEHPTNTEAPIAHEPRSHQAPNRSNRVPPAAAAGPTEGQRLYQKSLTSTPSFRGMGPRPMPSSVRGGNPNNADREHAHLHRPRVRSTAPTPLTVSPSSRPPTIVSPTFGGYEPRETGVDPLSLYNSAVSSVLSKPNLPSSRKPRGDDRSTISDSSSVEGYSPYRSRASFISTNTYSTSRSR